MKLVVAVALLLGVVPIARADNQLPDPSDRILHWPLLGSEHPELAPRYAIAKDLADPGLDWVELCKMGAHKRTTPNQRDQTAYLGAWCAIANRDVDTGLATLGSLMTSTVRGLPAAIRVDIANVLANEGTADRARALLARAQIEDLTVRDRLAALFVDMNRLDDAREINDLALGVADRGVAACMRQARRIVMDADRYRGPGLDRRRLLSGSDSLCKELELELHCWLDLGTCGAYFKAQGRPNLVRLFEAYRLFSSGSPQWVDVMSATTAKMKTEADLAMALDLIELMAHSTCLKPQNGTVRGQAWVISYRTDLPAPIRQRVDDLLTGEELRACAY